VESERPPQERQADWRHQPHGRLGSSGLVALAHDTVERFSKRGVPLPAGNRLQRTLEILEQSHDRRLPIVASDPATLHVVAAAIRDVWEFQLIARTLPRQRDADLNGKLKVMLTGSYNSHKPRDFQFELLVGALFAMADIPSLPAGPDLRFLVHGEEWGVAAKRVRSGDQLGARTTKARQQLEQHGLRGLIAVNVDAFLQGVPAIGNPDEIGERFFNPAVARLHLLLPDLAKQQALLGIFMVGEVADWSFDGDKPRLAHSLIFQGRTFVDYQQDQQSAAVVDETFNRLEEGIGKKIQQVYRDLAPAPDGGNGVEVDQIARKDTAMTKDSTTTDRSTLELAYDEARETQQRLEQWADALDSKTISLFTVGSAALGGVAVLHQGPFTGWAAVLWWVGVAFWGVGTLSAFGGFYTKDFRFGPDPRRISTPEWLKQSPERYQASRLEDIAAAYEANRATVTAKANSLKSAMICTALEIAALVVAALLG